MKLRLLEFQDSNTQAKELQVVKKLSKGQEDIERMI